MIFAKIMIILSFIVGISSVNADSAGIVKMTNGLAYGGIPYGSISGMLAKFESPGFYPNYQGGEVEGRQISTPIIITPNTRAAGLAARKNGPVQIYKLPGVIAPGVVGTLSQIGY